MNALLKLAVFGLGLSAPFVAAAGQDSGSAANANAAFLKSEGAGLSPQTASEMALCGSLWERWEFVVQSSNVPAFNAGLHKELSPGNAKRKAKFWLKKSQKVFRRYEDDLADFGPMMAKAQERADDYYAAWVNAEPERATDLPEMLGTCR